MRTLKLTRPDGTIMEANILDKWRYEMPVSKLNYVCSPSKICKRTKADAKIFLFRGMHISPIAACCLKCLENGVLNAEPIDPLILANSSKVDVFFVDGPPKGGAFRI